MMSHMCEITHPRMTTHDDTRHTQITQKSVMSHYAYFCDVGASRVGLGIPSDHPRMSARLYPRACLVWYVRGEALSPASLPTVGDRVCRVVLVSAS